MNRRGPPSGLRFYPSNENEWIRRPRRLHSSAILRSKKEGVANRCLGLKSLDQRKVPFAKNADMVTFVARDDIRKCQNADARIVGGASPLKGLVVETSKQRKSGLPNRLEL